jgi:dTDP-4-dehydrorhamnose reductase
MRVAVTGANGLLGAEVVSQLLGKHQVLALGRGPCRLPGGPFAWASVELGDVSAVEAALLEFRAESVLHAGALTDVDACERDPEAAWRVNVEGTASVARASRRLGARLVAVSTDYVFDGQSGPYAEDAIPHPVGTYARSKRCGEEAAMILSPDCAVARVAVVYSGRPGARATFSTSVVEKLRRGEAVKAFEDQQVSTTLASSGAAMCLELLLETEYQGVLHVSDAAVLSRVAFAAAVARRFGLKPNIVPVRTADAALPAPRPLKGGLIVERAARLLRNKPLSLNDALGRFFEEWQAREAG